MKLQSAMEYLGTYGWAILIMVVALIGLAAFGVFSSHPPTVSPGSCSVTKNTFGSASLSGVCNSGLPQFVTQMTSGQVGVSSILVQPSTTQFSESAWVYFTSLPTESEIAGEGAAAACGSSSIYCLIYFSSTKSIYFGYACGSTINTVGSFSPSANTWYNIVATFSSTGTSYIYVNGQQKASGTVCLKSGTADFDIGSDSGADPFSGYISNVQLYSAALSAAGVQALYDEGIGGAPIDTQDIMAWWPLNGNTKDYSGNSYNAAGSGISYISNWYSSYTPP